MRIYLDNCVYNRLYDNQNDPVIYMEAHAVLEIERRIVNREVELVSSYVVNFECSKCPNIEQRRAISDFIAKNASVYVGIDKSKEVLEIAKRTMSKGIKLYDALHVACAVVAECDYFISTDKRLLKCRGENFKMVNPIVFLMENNDI